MEVGGGVGVAGVKMGGEVKVTCKRYELTLTPSLSLSLTLTCKRYELPADRPDSSHIVSWPRQASTSSGRPSPPGPGASSLRQPGWG